MSGIQNMLLGSATAEPLAIDIDQANRSGSCNSFGGSCNAVSSTATTTVTGGKAPFTFLWSFVSGDLFGINGLTSPSASFSKTNTVPAFLSGVYRCTVTDDNSDTASDTVGVNLTYTDLS